MLVAGGLALTGLAPARQAYLQRQRIVAEERRLAALQAENGRLSERLQRLNDPEYVEKLAREQLGLVKPGEVSYVVVPPPEEVTATARTPVDESKSLWDKAMDLVDRLLR